MSDDKDVRISNEGQPMTDDERVLARRFFEEHVWRGAFAQPMPNPVYALVELLRDVRRQERERRGESDPYEVAALLVERQASIHRMRAQSFADDSDRADGEAQADDIDRATAAAEALEYTASRIRELARKGGGG